MHICSVHAVRKGRLRVMLVDACWITMTHIQGYCLKRTPPPPPPGGWVRPPQKEFVYLKSASNFRPL